MQATLHLIFEPPGELRIALLIAIRAARDDVFEIKLRPRPHTLGVAFTIST